MRCYKHFFRLPLPAVPSFSLMADVALDALIIAEISYIITLSMGLIFAQKLNYEVNANQELLAMVSFAKYYIFFANVL